MRKFLNENIGGKLVQVKRKGVTEIGIYPLSHKNFYVLRFE